MTITIPKYFSVNFCSQLYDYSLKLDTFHNKIEFQKTCLNLALLNYSLLLQNPNTFGS